MTQKEGTPKVQVAAAADSESRAPLKPVSMSTGETSPRPGGRDPSGRGAVAGSARPHPAGRQSPPQRIPDDRDREN